MAERNDGGAAFPGPYVTKDGTLEVVWKQGGMTLRDYFAAQYLHGLAGGDYFDGPEPDQGRPQAFAERCYQMADAMLAEREK